MVKIVTYNVNGIRSAISKGWMEWVFQVNPDIICLQEIKALEGQIDELPFKEAGYELYWFSAQKKGYSGTAIFTKISPSNVEYGCGMELYDAEGRIIRADFDGFSVMSAYFPSGSSGDHRQDVKMKFLNDFHQYVNGLKKVHPNLIILGDVNICHKPIDIHDPVSNKNSSGFLPEEREWMENFLNSGFIDVFRVFNQEPHQYTWWSFRAASRERNKGWRIDYALAAEPLRDKLLRCVILPEAKHSDHCPVLVEIDF
ncbi:MAG: exodeoxyribonuclease III [Flavobacteriales bacterium]|nr:exodeoxyribonuclease III [Flavobacteriales bacterium]